MKQGQEDKCGEERGRREREEREQEEDERERVGGGGEEQGGRRVAVTGVKNEAKDGWCKARRVDGLKIYSWKCEV